MSQHLEQESRRSSCSSSGSADSGALPAVRHLDELLPHLKHLRSQPGLPVPVVLTLQAALPTLELLRRLLCELPDVGTTTPSTVCPSSVCAACTAPGAGRPADVSVRATERIDDDVRLPTVGQVGRLRRGDNNTVEFDGGDAWECNVAPLYRQSADSRNSYVGGGSPPAARHDDSTPQSSRSRPTLSMNLSLSAMAAGTPDINGRRSSSATEAGAEVRFPAEPALPRGCYIHPEHKWKLCWDLCSMALILVVILVVPIEICFLWNEERELPALATINLVSDVFFSMDIVLNCFTAYYRGRGASRRLVTNPRSILQHYAKFWLPVDLVATMPIADIAKLATGGGSDDQSTEVIGMLKALKVAKVTRILKVLRVLKLCRLMQLVEEQLVSVQSMTVAFQLSKLAVRLVLICHTTACIWFLAGNIGIGKYDETWLQKQNLVNQTFIDQYSASFYFAIATGTTVGYGDIHATNTLERVVGSMLMLGAVAYMGHFLARMQQVVSSFQPYEAEMLKLKKDAMIFMKKRGVPKDLYNKILRYIEHIYEMESVTLLDQRLLEKLSESLQMELALAVTGSFLKKFPLFVDADEAFMTAICQVCQTRRAGTGDIVVQEGRSSEEMFLVVRGEVIAVHRGRYVGVLRAEDWFGERSLFFPGLVHNVTIRCETDCEFLVLTQHEFKQQLAHFPRVQREYDRLVSRLLKGNESISAGSFCSDEVSPVRVSVASQSQLEGGCAI